MEGLTKGQGRLIMEVSFLKHGYYEEYKVECTCLMFYYLKCFNLQHFSIDSYSSKQRCTVPSWLIEHAKHRDLKTNRCVCRKSPCQCGTSPQPYPQSLDHNRPCNFPCWFSVYALSLEETCMELAQAIESGDMQSASIIAAALSRQLVKLKIQPSATNYGDTEIR